MSTRDRAARGAGGPFRSQRHVGFTLAERRGSGGARSPGGLGGPSGANCKSTSRSRSATAPPGREARGAWGTLSKPTACRFHAREAPRLRRGARRGGLGGPFRGQRQVDFTLAKRHGSAGARSVGGLGGPFGAPHLTRAT